MAENTKIEWATHTFNPWWGCTKIAPGCTNCYAATFAKRTGKAEWGDNGSRMITSEANWAKPLKWNKLAAAAGERPRVFCASMADVFEDWRGEACDHAGNAHYTLDCDPANVATNAQMRGADADGYHYTTLADARSRLFALIDLTPNLDWLLLTKRPENILRMWPKWTTIMSTDKSAIGEQRHARLNNVWLGTSISDQATADQNIPELLKCRALSPVLFLSAEPLLGRIQFRGEGCQWCYGRGVLEGGQPYPCPACFGIDWVIAGGESGHHARPMHPDWARGLRDQCTAADVPFFFKQWGEWAARHTKEANSVPVLPLMDKGRHGVFAPDGQWRENEGEFSRYENLLGTTMFRIGKKAAGRLLDGVEWNQFPEVTNANL